MLDVKNNFRNKYRDNLCRGCGQEPETQKHVLEECTTLQIDNQTKTNEGEFFSEDIDILREAAKKIKTVLDKLSESTAPLQG